MADFDLSKLKGNMGELVGSIKSMINPAGGTPAVDPDDALGVKIAQLTTLVRQMGDAQQEQVKNLAKVNDLLNTAFNDIKLLRDSVKEKKTVEKPVEQPVETPSVVKEEEKS